MSKSKITLPTVTSSEKSHAKEYHPDHENEQESMPITRFTEKYSTKWRWALLIHILSLIRNIDIKNIDKNRLTFLVEMPGTEECIEEFFSELFNLVSKQCMVNIRVTPLVSSGLGPKQYEIGIN